MITYFDSHAHVDDRKFDPDRKEVIKRAFQQGIKYIMLPGVDLMTCQESLEIAREYENIYASIGIHPHETKLMDDSTITTLKLMAKNPKVKAIGEIGLDYYHNHSPRDVQEIRFREQIRLAKELGLPIVIHDRDANERVMMVLKEEKAFVNGVQMHSYSGSAELARQYVKLGAHISISGPVTFKNARVKQEVVASVPLERLLIETDSPYLTPEPFRGKRNEPSYVRFVAEKIAEIKCIPIEKVAEQTTKNALDFFGI